MDAFKLLSRSTNLKQVQLSERKQRALHVPSAGQIRSSPTDVEETYDTAHRAAVASGKRKRETSQSAQVSAETLTSDMLDHTSGSLEGQRDNATELSHDFTCREAANSKISQAPGRVSPDECRSIFRSHKVNIAALTGDLRGGIPDTLNESRKASKRKTSEVGPISRKRQKEASRLYTQPLTSFRLLKTFYGASKALSNNVREQGYTTPTEVQLATIPLLLDPAAAGLHLPPDCSEIDLLTVAPTGSGKTLAFLIPLIDRLVHDHHRATAHDLSRHVSALIVAPTKELVSQIVNEGRKLCSHTGVSITAMRKGMHINAQQIDPTRETAKEKAHTMKTLDRPSTVKADIVVTTPMLLANTITQDKGDLSSVRHFILDEADVLLDPLFRGQTLSLWNACTNPSMRVSLWSATIGSNIEELVMDLIHQREVRLETHHKSPLLRCIIGHKDSALSTISHKLIYAATEPGKLLGLRHILHPSTMFQGNHAAPRLRPPFLVFTQTIERAVALHAELLYDIPTEAGGSSRIAVLHSDLSDLKRADVMKMFRRGQIWVLITTDLLSRGIDFRGVNGVVNYDIPTSSAAYVHRVGRTGRAGRLGGMAVTFYTKDDIKYVKAIANAIAASEKARGETKVANGEDVVQGWLLSALPDISKKDRQELKKKGVNIRRKTREGEDDKEARAKRTARISTKSGYERRLENNLKGAIAGNRDMVEDESEEYESDTWTGFEG